MPEEKKFTVVEAAKILNASRATITKWCRKGLEGKFPNAEKVDSPIGSYWLIPESDVKKAGEVKMGRPRKDE